MTDPVTNQPSKNLQERLWTIQHSRNATQYSKHTYGYDSAARLTGWLEEASGSPAPVANSFGYNSSDELTSHTSRWHPNGSALELGQWNYDNAGNIIATGDASTMTTRSYDLNLNSLTRIGGAGKIRVEGTMSAYSSVRISIGNNDSIQAVVRSNPAGGYRYEAELEVQQGYNLITVTASLLDPLTGQPPVGAPQVVTQQYQYQVSGVSRNFSTVFSRITEDKNSSFVNLRRFDYDAKNRLKIVTVGGTVTEWDYDWADRRVREWQYPQGGSKPAWPAKLYIWDGTELVQERVCTSTYNSGGTVSRTHYFGGFNDGATLSGTKYQTTTDHLGNVRDVINASGTLVARYDYTPWGKPTKVSGTTVNASLLINSRYYHHAASGLHLALYRAYDPDLGRWLSEDPIEEEGGINMYGFVGNNPLMAVDPLGLVDSVTTSTCAGGATGALARGILKEAAEQAAARAAARAAANQLARNSIAVRGHTIRNMISNVFNRTHFNAASRELRGQVVKLRNDGKPFDHVNEVREAVRCMKNQIKALKKVADDSNVDEAIRAEMNALMRQANDAILDAFRYVPGL